MNYKTKIQILESWLNLTLAFSGQAGKASIYALYTIPKVIYHLLVIDEPVDMIDKLDHLSSRIIIQIGKAIQNQGPRLDRLAADLRKVLPKKKDKEIFLSFLTDTSVN